MGLHFGLGGKEDNSIHLDLVSADSQIYFDDKVIFNEKLLFSGDFKWKGSGTDPIITHNG